MVYARGQPMFKPVEVKPLANYRLWLKYTDGVTGTVDLSHLAGKGVFALWDDYAAFERVYVGESGEIAWTEEIDLCPDALYMKITGKTPEQLFPNLEAEVVHA
jgi:hypothetical protein